MACARSSKVLFHLSPQMQNNVSELITWLNTRPYWTQEATRRLQKSETLTPSDIKELAELCKKPPTNAPKLASDALRFTAVSNAVTLNSISDPKGIDELSPKKSLNFHDKLTIVYGTNGSGKSGYIRILKRICGARMSKDLIGSVFLPAPAVQSCKVGYLYNGSSHDLVWKPADGVHSHLNSIEIYDTDSGSVYTTQDNEILFEPPLLALLQKLIEAADAVDVTLKAEIAALTSKKPVMPPGLAGTRASIWYGNTKATLKNADIDLGCKWEKDDQEKLEALNVRLAQTNPAEEAKKLRKRKTSIVELATLLNGIRSSIDDTSLDLIKEARTLAANKRKAASEDAEKVFGQAPLTGIGEASWKALWEQARIYSTEIAYKGIPFPKTDSDARCVLCQQTLDDAAKERLVSFEQFVKGQLEKDAKAAETNVDTLIKGLPIVDTEEILSAKLASFLITEDETKLVTEHVKMLRERVAAAIAQTDLPALPSEEAITVLTRNASDLEAKAKVYDGDVGQEGKAVAQTEAKELTAQKWVNEQKAAVSAERDRLTAIDRLETARKLVNTKALSDKKTALTTELITEAFIKRFEDELRALSAERLRVEVVKTKTTKGQVWHQVRLKGSHGNAKAGQVLSEGEQRVVSLAAFLADSEGLASTTPFIFDDPISSLDQEFEESTVNRLIQLTRRRQVLVFTHRISLLTLLEDMATAEGIEPLVVGLQRESWGTGEPSDPPLFALKPIKVINTLLNERVPQARKIYNEKGSAAYAPEAKGICSDLRITLERLVECTLLNEVILRFRRSVTTKGRLSKLAKISPDDCKMIDDLMTEYSKYEHSQPGEAPVTPPLPDKLEADLKKLKAWHEEFTKR